MTIKQRMMSFSVRPIDEVLQYLISSTAYCIPVIQDLVSLSLYELLHTGQYALLLNSIPQTAGDSSGDLLYYCAFALFKMKQYDQADKLLHNPSCYRSRFLKGAICLAQGSHEKAAECFKGTDSLVMLGIIDAQQGLFWSAIQKFQTAAKLMDSNFCSLFNISLLYQQLQKYQTQEIILNFLLEGLAQEDYRFQQVVSQMTSSMMAKKDYHAAIKVYETIEGKHTGHSWSFIVSSPQDGLLLRDHVFCLLSTGEYENAVHHVPRLADVCASDPVSLMYCADAYLHVKQPLVARKWIERAYDVLLEKQQFVVDQSLSQTKVAICINFGVVLTTLLELDSALAMFNKALDIDSDHEVAAINKTILHFKMDQKLVGATFWVKFRRIDSIDHYQDLLSRHDLPSTPTTQLDSVVFKFWQAGAFGTGKES